MYTAFYSKREISNSKLELDVYTKNIVQKRDRERRGVGEGRGGEGGES